MEKKANGPGTKWDRYDLETLAYEAAKLKREVKDRKPIPRPREKLIRYVARLEGKSMSADRDAAFRTEWLEALRMG